MNVRNCRKCGKMFNYMMGPIVCPVCREAMEERFQVVKAYVREHKGVGIREVAEACEVDTSEIQQWLREERLELTSDSAMGLQCESCGQLIRSGRYCDSCKQSLASGLGQITRNAAAQARAQQAAAEKKDKEGPRMRFVK